MKKKILIILSSICLLIIINFLTIAVSINNFYKGLYHKDPNIIKSSINFPEFKENLKNTFNAILIDQSSKNKAKDSNSDKSNNGNLIIVIMIVIVILFLLCASSCLLYMNS